MGEKKNRHAGRARHTSLPNVFFNVIQCSICIFFFNAMYFLICLQIKKHVSVYNNQPSEVRVLCLVNYLFIGRDKLLTSLLKSVPWHLALPHSAILGLFSHLEFPFGHSEGQLHDAARRHAWCRGGVRLIPCGVIIDLQTHEEGPLITGKAKRK